MIGSRDDCGAATGAATARHGRDRAQANLAVLAVALILLTTVTGASIALAGGALAGATRSPTDRRAATAVASRLVAGDAPTTERADVVNRTTLDALNWSTLTTLAPPTRNRSVRIRLGDETLLDQGDPTGGVSVTRIVLVSTSDPETRTVNLSANDAVTLPRRAERVRVRIRSGPDTTVRTVRANDRVVLYDPDGLDGVTSVRISRYDTTRLTFDTIGAGNATASLTYDPKRTTKATLRVTVDG